MIKPEVNSVHRMGKVKKVIGIAVLNSLKDAYTETFIKAHIEHLAGKVVEISTATRYDPERIATGGASYSSRIVRLMKRTVYGVIHAVKEQQAVNFLKKHRVQVMLAEYGLAGVKALKICRKAGIPLVVHFHGYDAYMKEFIEPNREAYQALFRFASAIIAVSRDMEKQLVSLGAPPEKVHYNVYGVDTANFSGSDVLHSPKQLLAAGRFVEKKAPYLTILAFKKALETVPDARLVMVGNGPLLDVCRQLIRSLNLAGSIILQGAVSHGEIVRLLSGSRAFVQHSLTPASGDSEGTPNTVLEAQACGLPVISTKHAGIPDVVVHAETGYLVEEGDISTMAHYMVKVLTDPLLAARLGEAARRRVVEHYAMEQSIQKLKEILYRSAN